MLFSLRLLTLKYEAIESNEWAYEMNESLKALHKDFEWDNGLFGV